VSNFLTPEYSIGKKKHFPLQSSMSGFTPEQTIARKPWFPAAQSQMNVGGLKITPEKNGKRDFNRLDSIVNT
jgi:hypothetical protein